MKLVVTGVRRIDSLSFLVEYAIYDKSGGKLDQVSAEGCGIGVTVGEPVPEIVESLRATLARAEERAAASRGVDAEAYEREILRRLVGSEIDSEGP